MNRLNHNVVVILIYFVLVYLILIPIKFDWLVNASISLLSAFLLGMLNDIIIQLRKLNGEKFENIED